MSEYRRVSQETINLIKDTVHISDMMERFGVSVDNTRKKAWCPLCADKNSRRPGMSVNDEKGLWYCFVHSDGGDMFKFIMELEQVSFPEAIELIAKKFNIPIKYDQDSLTEEERSRMGKARKVLEEANEIFKKQRVSDKFKDFINNRQINKTSIDIFQLGMSDSKWSNQVIQRLLEHHSQEAIIDSGLVTVKDNTLILRLQDRIIFPIFSKAGLIIGFGGRNVSTHNQQRAKYINSPDTILFHKKETLYGIEQALRSIRKTKEAILCEGYMDTIALHSIGATNTIGVMGTAITRKNLKYLEKITNTIYIMLDNDKAGTDAAARTIKEIPYNYSTKIKVIQVPNAQGKDPDEWITNHHATLTDLQNIQKHALPLIDFHIKSTLKENIEQLEQAITNNDINTVTTIREQTIKKMSEIMKNLLPIMTTDEIMRTANWFVDTVHTTISADRIITEWQKQQKPQTNSTSTNNINNPQQLIPQSPKTRVPIEDDIILHLLATPIQEYNKILSEQQTNELKTLFSSSTRTSLYSHLLEQKKQHPNKDQTDIINNLPEPEQTELTRIQINQPDVQNVNIDNALKQLKKKKLLEELKQEENSPMPDFFKLISLKQEIAKLE